MIKECVKDYLTKHLLFNHTFSGKHSYVTYLWFIHEMANFEYFVRGYVVRYWHLAIAFEKES